MNKKLLFTIFTAVVLLISACTQSLSEQPSPSVVSTQNAAINSILTKTAEPNLTLESPTPSPTFTQTLAPLTSTPLVVVEKTGTPIVAPTGLVQGYDYAGLPACINLDESTPLSGAVQRNDGLWEIDIRSVSGCNLIFEGRIVPGEKLHRVIVLRSENGEINGFVQNGKFVYAEGSIWPKPREKNMEDIANLNDPAEALKLLNDKREVMDKAGYDWPIWLYFTDGTVTEFGRGEVWEGLTPQNHCDFSAPVEINVHGEKVAGKNQFSAAIGATDCITVAWIDGNDSVQWTDQRDAGNKVVYTTIEAWLMPSSWSQDQIDEWVAEHK